MTETCLVLGASGTLGRALMRAGHARGLAMTGAARSQADHLCDITDADGLAALWETVQPSLVINTAAVIDFGTCERDPAQTYLVNAHGPALLARLATRHSTKFVQISTDQFYGGMGPRPHREDEPVRVLHNYGAAKLAGESMALAAPNALVIRTNLSGFKGDPEHPTFAEWCIQSILDDRPITLFEDYYCSTIDADRLAAVIFDLIAEGASGTLNAASGQVFSKAAFICALAARFEKPLTQAKFGSAAKLMPRRCLSAGLDVSQAESILRYPLPTLLETIDALYTSYHQQQSEADQWISTRQCA